MLVRNASQSSWALQYEGGSVHVNPEMVVCSYFARASRKLTGSSNYKGAACWSLSCVMHPSQWGMLLSKPVETRTMFELCLSAHFQFK